MPRRHGQHVAGPSGAIPAQGQPTMWPGKSSHKSGGQTHFSTKLYLYGVVLSALSFLHVLHNIYSVTDFYRDLLICWEIC